MYIWITDIYPINQNSHGISENSLSDVLIHFCQIQQEGRVSTTIYGRLIP
jgi:hypothetical protein